MGRQLFGDTGGSEMTLDSWARSLQDSRRSRRVWRRHKREHRWKCWQCPACGDCPLCWIHLSVERSPPFPRQLEACRHVGLAVIVCLVFRRCFSLSVLIRGSELHERPTLALIFWWRRSDGICFQEVLILFPSDSAVIKGETKITQKTQNTMMSMSCCFTIYKTFYLQSLFVRIFLQYSSYSYWFLFFIQLKKCSD